LYIALSGSGTILPLQWLLIFGVPLHCRCIATLCPVSGRVMESLSCCRQHEHSISCSAAGVPGRRGAAARQQWAAGWRRWRRGVRSASQPLTEGRAPGNGAVVPGRSGCAPVAHPRQVCQGAHGAPLGAGPEAAGAFDHHRRPAAGAARRLKKLHILQKTHMRTLNAYCSAVAVPAMCAALV
jgi:hypothetical protein